MQVVKSSTYVDGCERQTKHTMYCSHYEFMCIYSILKLMVIPYPTDATPGESVLESERLHLLGQLPPVEVRSMEMILDEMSKSL